MVSSGFLQEPRGVTTQKTPFFLVTAVKTSNITSGSVFVVINFKDTHMLPNVLTGLNYKDLLQNKTPDFLAYVPLITHYDPHFIHDSVPAHFSLICWFVIRKFPSGGSLKVGKCSGLHAHLT
jgi:hypothetical protein